MPRSLEQPIAVKPAGWVVGRGTQNVESGDPGSAGLQLFDPGQGTESLNPESHLVKWRSFPISWGRI